MILQKRCMSSLLENEDIFFLNSIASSRVGSCSILPNKPKLFPVKTLLCFIESGRESIPMPIVVMGFSTSKSASPWALQCKLSLSVPQDQSFRSIWLASFKMASLMWILMISQITRLPAPPDLPSSFTSITLHSSCTGLSLPFTLVGFTMSDG